MNRLERFFRSVYDRSPPLGSMDPPPGGWEALQRRLEPKPPPAHRTAAPWLGALLLLGLIGILLYAFSTQTEQVEEMEYRERAATQAPAALTPNASRPILAPVPSGTAAPTLVAPPVVEEFSLAPPGDLTLSQSSPAVRPPAIFRTAAGRAPAPAADRRSVPVPDPSIPEPDTDPAMPPPRRVALLALLPLPPVTLDRDLSGRPHQIEVLPPVAVAKEPWRFVPLPREQPVPAVWEVSVRALPYGIRRYGHYEGFSTVPNGAGNYRAFTQQSGPPLILYSTQDVSTSIKDSRPGILMAGIEVARRFSSGFRLSLGTVRTNEGGRVDASEPDYARGLGSGEYRLVHTYTENWYAYWITLGAQYTINRRRRFRINVGVQLLGQAYERAGRRSFLVGGEPVTVQPVTASVSESRKFLDSFLPMPQVTFEYQLRSNWSLSAGVGGMSGVGATYRIR